MSGFTGMFGGGGSTNSTTTTKTEYSPEETAARARILAEGGNLYSSQYPTSGQYRGPGVVGFSDPSKAAFGMQTQTAGAAQPTALNALASADFNLGPGRFVSSNPYAADAIRAALEPIVRTHTTVGMPALRLGGMARGTGMGTRQGIAEGLATEALYRQLASTSAGMASGMYQSGQNAAVQTQGQLPMIMQGAQAPSAMMSQVGTTLENQAQQEENVAAARRLQEVNGPWEILQNYAGLTTGMANPTTTTTQAGERPGLSPMQGIGGALSLVSLLKGLF